MFHCQRVMNGTQRSTYHVIVGLVLALSFLNVQLSKLKYVPQPVECPILVAHTSELKRGGIHACTYFTTRYEAQHIVPWIHYHSKIGISYFHLYFDSITSNLDNPIERKAYDLISILPNVHVYDVHDLNIHDKSGFGDMGSYPHCTKFAHLMLDADWVVHFDIDEAFSFKTPLDNEPDCDHSEYGIPVGALIDFTSTIPHDVSAVIFPRFGFNTNGIISPPESKSQMELYLQRSKHPEVGGKVLLRTKSIKTTYSFDKHRVISPVKGSVIYPSGLNASSDNCIEDKDCYYVDLQYPSEMYTSAPVLYHYTTRSVEECRDKLKGTEEMMNSTGYVSWRKNTGDICTEHNDNSNTDRDYTLFCAGKAVSLELKGLFPAYDQSPFVF